MKPMHIDEVPRNDLEAAHRYYESHGKVITGEVYHLLWMSQDDPTEFEKMAAKWRIVENP